MPSPTSTPTPTTLRERNRANQAASRQRTKSRLALLEARLAAYERAGVSATAEVQQAARAVAAENTALRRLLGSFGVGEKAVSEFLRGGVLPVVPEIGRSAIAGSGARDGIGNGAEGGVGTDRVPCGERASGAGCGKGHGRIALGGEGGDTIVKSPPVHITEIAGGMGSDESRPNLEKQQERPRKRLKQLQNQNQQQQQQQPHSQQQPPHQSRILHEADSRAANPSRTTTALTTASSTPPPRIASTIKSMTTTSTEPTADPAPSADTATDIPASENANASTSPIPAPTSESTNQSTLPPASTPKPTPSSPDETLCQDAAQIIASLRGRGTSTTAADEVWAELGCGPDRLRRCRMKNVRIFELADTRGGTGEENMRGREEEGGRGVERGARERVMGKERACLG